MLKINSYAAAAKIAAVVAAFVLFAPIAFAAVMQAAQIVG